MFASPRVRRTQGLTERLWAGKENHFDKKKPKFVTHLWAGKRSLSLSSRSLVIIQFFFSFYYQLKNYQHSKNKCEWQGRSSFK